MARFPLGGTGADFDSIKSRSNVTNLIAEIGANGEYKSVTRTEGLTLFAELPKSPLRSNLLSNSGFVYAVAGDTLYRVDSAATITSLGAVGGGNTVAQLRANSAPGDNQILVLNGVGLGFIYTNIGGLLQITDADFKSTTFAAVLNERFYFTRDGTNEFFASSIGDGFVYDPLSFASAEESPDQVVAVVAKRSSMWVCGTTTIEQWQSATDVIFPLRRVIGATIQRGVLAKNSIAELADSFAFLADDRTVRMVTGTRMDKISDLELELRINGNGTPTFPGFGKIDDARGFFIDGPVHKVYCLTFPSEKYTWCYDLTTGISHERSSDTLVFWRGLESVIFNNINLVGDFDSGKLFQLDASAYTEDGDILRTVISTPTLSFEKDVTIPYLEIEMEVGQTLNPSANLLMIVKYSKDGGITFVTWGTIELGKIGEYRRRVVMRSFGRLVRHTNFVLELSVTDPVRIQYYGLYGEINEAS